MNIDNNKINKYIRDLKDFCASPYSDSISGFYDFTGYWKRYDELAKVFPQDDLLAFIEASKEFNLSTIKNIMCAEARTWINKYGNKRGRKSNTEKKLLSMLSNPTRFATEKLSMLNRVKVFVSLTAKHTTHITKDNVMEIINKIIVDTIPNAIFRLKILYGFARNTEYENLAKEYLAKYINMDIQQDGIEIYSDDIEIKIDKLRNAKEEMQTEQNLLVDLIKMKKEIEYKIAIINNFRRDILNNGNCKKILEYRHFLETGEFIENY